MSDRKALSALIVRPDKISHDFNDSLFWKSIQEKLDLSIASVSVTTVSAVSSRGLKKKHDLVVLLLRRQDLHLVPLICLCDNVSFVCVCLDFFPAKKIIPICRMFGHVKWRALKSSVNLN